MMPNPYPTLPEGLKRFSVEQLLIELAPFLGLRSSRLHALLFMMKQTAPGAWTDPTKEPIFFAAQDQTALALNKTPRALYDDEVALEKAGLIEKRVKGNGARSSYGGCGIVFSRLIALVPDLIALKDRLWIERCQRKHLRNRRSACVRTVKRLLARVKPDALQDAKTAAMVAQFKCWPSAVALATLTMEEIVAHVTDAEQQSAMLCSLLVERSETSSKPEENFRCYIQENIKETSDVTCNEIIVEPDDGLNADIRSDAKQHDNPAHHAKTQLLARQGIGQSSKWRLLEPEALFDLAGPDMQVYIQAAQMGSSDLRDTHIIDAAKRILYPLGISFNAWIQAVESMGEHGAALCVLLLDANRDHPVCPVHNPGGALRAMTQRFRQGRLNLIGSLIGLKRRRTSVFGANIDQQDAGRSIMPASLGRTRLPRALQKSLAT